MNKSHKSFGGQPPQCRFSMSAVTTTTSTSTVTVTVTGDNGWRGDENPSNTWRTVERKNGHRKQNYNHNQYKYGNQQGRQNEKFNNEHEKRSNIYVRNLKLATTTMLGEFKDLKEFTDLILTIKKKLTQLRLDEVLESKNTADIDMKKINSMIEKGYKLKPDDIARQSKADVAFERYKNLKEKIDSGKITYDDVKHIKAEQIGKFIEILISWSLHEVFSKDKDLFGELKSINEFTGPKESDGHKIIHWVPWARYLTNPSEMDQITKKNGFKRTEKDMFETLRLCLLVGSSPFDINKREKSNESGKKESETAIGALIAAGKKVYDDGRKLMTKEIFREAYNILLHPSKESGVIQKTCCSVLNKISPVNFKNYVNVFNWCCIANTPTLCTAIIDSFSNYTKATRNAIKNCYPFVKERMQGIISAISQKPTYGPNDDLTIFFDENKVQMSELAKRFTEEMVKQCSSISLDENKEQKRTFDIIGAIFGEIADDATVMDFCLKRMDKYLSVVRTCLVHRKLNNSQFMCDIKLVERMIDAYNKAKEQYERFQILGTLSQLFDRQISADSFDELLKIVQTNNTHSKQRSDEKDVSLNDCNPYIDRVNLTGLCNIKSEKSEDYKESTEYIIKNLNELFDGIKGDITKLPYLCEAILMKAMESITTDYQITMMVSIIGSCNKMNVIKKVAVEKGSDLLESVDSPRWAPKVLKAFTFEGTNDSDDVNDDEMAHKLGSH